MYVSRLPFHVVPGQTTEVVNRLQQLETMISHAGGGHCRILRSHFGSDGAPDVVFEQEVTDLAELEKQIEAVTSRPEFQQWSQGMSPLLSRTPKREAYLVTAPH
ncbi:MAG: hypothetical protein AB7P33_08730 [Dehalococcoidia bacterium]